MEIFINIIGWVGAVLILTAYFMLVTNHVKVKSYLYEFMNLFGAIFVGINVFYLSAWPSLFINTIWVCIAIVGIYKISKK